MVHPGKPAYLSSLLQEENPLHTTMTTPNMNGTPPRNAAASKRPPVTCWIPRTPASKSAARGGQSSARTVPRLTSPSPILRREQVLGSARHSMVSPSPGDRFICNHGKMNMEQCRASVLPTKKRRMESIGKAATRRRRRLNGSADPNATAPLQAPQTEPETLLQAEFPRHMKVASFVIPLDRLEMERTAPAPSSRESSDNNSNSSGTLDSIVAPTLSSRSVREPNDVRYLAYATAPELEAGSADW